LGGIDERQTMSIQRRPVHGFTLIEVLVALVVMSLMAVLTWQGVGGMAKASSQYRSRADDVAAIQTALLQWRTDLDQMIDASQTPPAALGGSANIAKAIEFDSRVLRVTRRYAGDEIRVVAWGGRQVDTATGGTRRLMRWVSEPVRTRAEWQAAWDQAARWGQNPTERERALETAVLSMDNWQIFYYRNDAWSNPLSADGATPLANTSGGANPDGVRLILQLAPGQIPGGTLSMDWVQPTRGGGKS
jgi:general secretion pathway protein J